MKFVSAATVTAVLLTRSAFVYAVPIYGGPAYDQNTNAGYNAQMVPVVPGSTAGDGFGVGGAAKYATDGTSLGSRAVRLNASAAGPTELGTLGTTSYGYTSCLAYAVNASGTVAGIARKFASNDDITILGQRAVRWDASGTAATELGNLGTDTTGYTSAFAYAINTAGTIVGSSIRYSSNVDQGFRAVRWAASGTAATQLGILGTDTGGNTRSEAYAINAAGTSVGFAYKYTSGTSVGQRAVRWNASGTTATELGNLGLNSFASTNATALALNAAGTAVGSAYKYSGGTYVGQRAVRWNASGTAATELDSLGTDVNGSTNNIAYAINASGIAVGVAVKYDAGNARLGDHAVRWDASGTAVTELGNLGTDSNGNTVTHAFAINAGGITVGNAETYDLNGGDLGSHAVAWGTDGIALDLNTLLSPEDAAVWTLTDARGISDTNWVTGVGNYYRNGTGQQLGYTRAFLIQIPEPASLATLAFTGIAMLARRRTR